MGQLDVDSSNWSSGAGLIDGVNTLVTSIRHAHDGDRAAVAAEIGLAAVSMPLDVVAMALDPLSKLTAAGLGWLIEHVAFLRKPLDLLAGNPEEIAHMAEQLHEFAEVLRNAASDLASTSRTASAEWRGLAADAFTDTMAVHRHRMEVAGQSVDAAGYVVETSGAIIAALRDLIRDMITSVLGDIVSTMLVALAAAPFTFGASIAVGVSRCVVVAVAGVVQMMARIAKVLGLSGRAAQRISDLVEILGRLAKDLGGTYHDLRGITRGKAADDGGTGRPPSASDDGAAAPGSPSPPLTHGNDFHDDGLGDEVYRDWLNADRHFNGGREAEGGGSRSAADPHGDRAEPPSSGASPAHTPEPLPAGVAAAKKSPLKGFEVAALKKHEGWLKGQGFGDELHKVKFVDGWLKKNHPEAYPYLKAMSDAKSSKNYVGLADKAALTLAKELTDIRGQAEEAWQRADEQGGQEQSEPASDEGSSGSLE